MFFHCIPDLSARVEISWYDNASNFMKTTKKVWNYQIMHKRQISRRFSTALPFLPRIQTAADYCSLADAQVECPKCLILRTLTTSNTTGRARLNGNDSSARFSFELSGNSK